jgi:choice-of-anchor B domain-containing protein
MSFPLHVPGRLRTRGGALAAGVLLAAGLLSAVGAAEARGSDSESGSGGAQPASANPQWDVDSVADLPPIGRQPCVRGFAGPFRCNKVDLMSFMPMDTIGGGPDSIYGGPGNDVWGWTDPLKKRGEWVIAGRSNGTSFIDVRKANRPVFVADLPSHGETELHSDMKVYRNHAYIVKDGPGNGIQVFDLTRLRDIDYDDAPVTVEPDAVYTEISNAHDIAINEDTGFAYVVGATGGAIGELANVVTIAGSTYQAAGANFGPEPDATGVSASVVLANDGVDTTTDGCEPLVGFPAGSIALIDRGTCGFTQKAGNAQAAGAVGMIVANNVSGDPFTMGGSDPSITIPSVMVSLDDGTAIKAGLPASGTISANPEANTCDEGGLHIVDIRDPKNPTFAGCFDDEGYVHDTQCVVYHGPDVAYQGRELCFNANPGSSIGDAVTIVDVTDHANPVMVGQVFEGEPATYSHQGWLTPDHRYFLHDDESDNGSSSSAIPGRSRTRVFDVTDLEQPFLQSVYHGLTRAPVHNLYTRENYMYNANYIDGLRIVDFTDIDNPGTEFAPETPSAPDHQGLEEVACFDTDPFRNDMGEFPNGRTAWGGSWSNYPYFASGTVVVSGFDGLFLVRPRLDKPNDSRYAACLPD